jgi:hypothetical protein
MVMGLREMIILSESLRYSLDPREIRDIMCSPMYFTILVTKVEVMYQNILYVLKVRNGTALW